MATKKQKGVKGKIFKVAMLIPAAFSLMGNLFALIQVEMATIRKKLLCFLLLSLFSLMLMLSSWIFLNVILLTYLMHVPYTLLTSLVVIFAGNFMLLIITCLMMMYLKIDPSFPETRRTVREVISRK